MKRVFRNTASMSSMVAIALAACLLLTGAADSVESIVGRFEGQALLTPFDDDPFVPRFRLIGELRFSQAGGRVWITPSGAILDGRSMPTVFVQLFDHPLQGDFLKTAISYEYAVKEKNHAWQEAQRMFYQAALTEGIIPVEAKVMYTVLSASGSRWAMRGPNSCFSRCHVSEKELEWRPRVDHEKLVSLLSWVRSESPSLDAIDQRAAETIIEKGPHIFGTLR